MVALSLVSVAANVKDLVVCHKFRLAMSIIIVKNGSAEPQAVANGSIRAQAVGIIIVDGSAGPLSSDL